jgi:hypothetical protein
MSKPKKKTKRAASLVPGIIQVLKTSSRFTCKFSDLPESYRNQPYNLASKIASRGGIQVRAVFNKDQDAFCLIRQS